MNTADKHLIPGLNAVEFGGAITVSHSLLEKTSRFDTTAIDLVAMQLSRNYMEAKFINFPTWDGHPEILNRSDNLSRNLVIAWYALVPTQYIIKENK